MRKISKNLTKKNLTKINRSMSKIRNLAGYTIFQRLPILYKKQKCISAYFQYFASITNHMWSAKVPKNES
jgi:hypothetical protein